MWPLLLGAGIFSILAKLLSDNNGITNSNEKDKKRIFISFAIEDTEYRDFLVLQSKNKKSPFTFIDMSVKKPWSEVVWKDKCRTKIKKCDGMIVLLSKNTWHSSGTKWEIKCAKEEEIPVIGMHIKRKNRGANLPELDGVNIIDWTWSNIHSVVNKF